MNLIAVDVSKEKLDVLFDHSGNHFVIPNTKPEIKKLITRIKRLNNPKLVFEASGGYDKPLKQIALDSGITCNICNGKRVREFARSQGLLAKTDKLDTHVIAQYVKTTVLPDITTRNPNLEMLRELNTRRAQILSLINQEENQFEHQHIQVIQESIDLSLEMLRKQLKLMDQEIKKLIDSDKELKDKMELLLSIPGIGPVSSVTLLVELPELGSLSKSKVASLAGLAPMNQDSGKFKGQRKTKHSRKRVKAVLYMAAIAAIRSNPKIKAFYKNLKAKGKKGKVALTACMRKLVIYANAMLKTRKKFQA